MSSVNLEGRMGDLFEVGQLDDPYPLLGRLRAEQPVYAVPGTDFHLVTSWRLVSEAAARTADFSSHLTGVLVQQPDGPPITFDLDGGGQAVHVLATADDPVHTAHRKLVMPVLTKRIRTLEPSVRRLADELWATGLRGDRIDWATGMADRLPLALIAELIGLPSEDVPQLLIWAYDSTEMLGGVVTSERLPELVTSATSLAAYLHDALRAARDPATLPHGSLRAATGPTTLLHVLASACRTGELTEEVAVLILVQLVGAGGESTAGLIASAARVLATNPVLQQRLRADPELLPALLDEALRWESPFRAHHRHVVADTVLGDTALAADSHLLLLWGAANRDPAAFPEPDSFDIDRPNVRRHLAFGKGAHFCIGSALARLEASAAISTLLRETREFGIDPDDPPQWVPSIFVRRYQRLQLMLEQ
ncbi:cytochrome P450 [Nocardia sp. NPDC127579]|uniref:cytochrome P450 n=1 Tax=Nocardia sp. NPDC127579 TaxID=3345402 RepID=UPI00364136B5